VAEGPAAAGFDDSHIFALGGNAIAVLEGLANDAQTARIVSTAEARRDRHQMSTIAAVLLPPYPQGFFQHPILAKEFEYQNGGQWDWFAGRFILAEFQRGHAHKAYRHLREVAQRVSQSHGLFEWYTRDDQGRGSQSYAGSAGALAAAVYQGLFGIDLRGDGYGLRVRLGPHDASVRIAERATGRQVFYEYAFQADSGRMSIRFDGNVALTDGLHLLLPEGWTASSASLDGRAV
jgi:hypothetical protein